MVQGSYRYDIYFLKNQESDCYYVKIVVISVQMGRGDCNRQLLRIVDERVSRGLAKISLTWVRVMQVFSA